MIRIECKFEASISRHELDDYIRGLQLSVIAYTSDGMEVVLGRMGADQLLLTAAETDAADLFCICDNDSETMNTLFAALFDETYSFQAELEVNDNTDHVLFLWHSVFHPKLRPYQSSIINTLSEMFGNDCAIVMRRTACDLDDRELADLGFKKIAGTDFVFRHLAYVNEFSRANPQGTDVPHDFEADEEDAEWVLERWDVEEE